MRQRQTTKHEVVRRNRFQSDQTGNSFLLTSKSARREEFGYHVCVGNRGRSTNVRMLFAVASFCYDLCFAFLQLSLRLPSLVLDVFFGLQSRFNKFNSTVACDGARTTQSTEPTSSR